jgi:hypothetical protein
VIQVCVLSQRYGASFEFPAIKRCVKIPAIKYMVSAEVAFLNFINRNNLMPDIAKF